ncbi:type II toxin-antitoxin system RelE/ParE family toxin [Pseudomonas profundi]|uniref:type II toxin-antitoxin system RelE/ParE family toxin n=1 Tax=Pseudomonas profundi TaxID=1981513 RepID=UPI001CC24384|nr:type II toxin-antitoxin system RelE/ParE family toxin [Pseudomonas profundi]
MRAIPLAEITEVVQTRVFGNALKRLHANQKRDLDAAIRELVANPDLGEQKKGELAFLRVYKFKMVNQLTLLGYSYEEDAVVLYLLVLGAHENFYRDVRRGG